jgi:hypothetical protein
MKAEEETYSNAAYIIIVHKEKKQRRSVKINFNLGMFYSRMPDCETVGRDSKKYF